MMKKMKRLSALVLLLALCFALSGPVTASNNDGVVFTAELSAEQLPYSDEDQTVSVSLVMSQEHLMDSAQYRIVCDIPGISFSEPTNTPSGIGIFDPDILGFAWMANNDVPVQSLGTYEITIPGGTKAGSYTIRFKEIMLSANFAYWEEDGSAAAVLTISGGDEPGHLFGDVNGDGKISSEDALLLFRHVSGQSVDADDSIMDINKDGKINNRDAILLFRIAAAK